MNKDKFKAYNTVYNRLRRAAKKSYYDNQFNIYTRNCKKTWTVIREIIGTKKEKSQLPDFFKENENIITDYLEIANGFNDFFSQVGPSFLLDENTVSFNFSRISETLKVILPPAFALAMVSFSSWIFF